MTDDNLSLPNGWQRVTPIAPNADLLFQQLIKLSGNRWFFRGESQSFPSRRSSWGRIPAFTQSDSFLDEFDMILQFQRDAIVYLDDTERALVENSMIGWLMLMQHHYAPTKLLDWTLSAWVALYHATRNDFDKNGYIWAFHTTSYYQNQSRESGVWSKRLVNAKDPREYVDLVNDMPADVVFPVNQLSATKRMIAQQGVYTFAGSGTADHAELLGRNSHPNTCLVIEVSSNLKPELSDLLRSMNLWGAAMFPGLDGVGLGVSEMMRSKP